MAEVKWIKIVTDIFDDEKIRFIETLPNGDAIIVIWFKLLCMCGKSNKGGFLMMTDKIAYTDEMLSSIFNKDIKFIRHCLDTFIKLDMIEVIDNRYFISNWEKHQSIDKLDQIREQTRLRVAKHREKQKLIECNVTVTPKVTQGNALDKDIEEDIDKELEKDIDIDKEIYVDTNVSMSVFADTPAEELPSITVDDNILNQVLIKNNLIIDFEDIKKQWNSKSMLKEIVAITDKRKTHLTARIKEHGIESIYKVIDNVSKSSFLRGQNKQGWMADFDWVIRPNNYIKVLEGNYLDNQKSSYSFQSEIEERAKRIEERLGIKS